MGELSSINGETALEAIITPQINFELGTIEQINLKYHGRIHGN